MRYLYNSYTTTGRVKKVNQDSVFLMKAEADEGEVLFAAISDGMGGLAKGEEASARMTQALSAWFRDELPDLLYSNEGITQGSFRRSLLGTIHMACLDIEDYARKYGAQCGTTLAGILLYKNNWYAVNVGDSRVYIHDGYQFEQITKDQSYVQREIDAGRMTEEEAKTHKMRSMLLQCIGASDVVIPDWYYGEIKGEETILICSDGFRHVIPKDELSEILNPDKVTKENMRDILENCSARSMDGGERDNISAILIKTEQPGEEVNVNAGNRFGNRWKV